jgi:quinol monooxygenase YgiN
MPVVPALWAVAEFEITDPDKFVEIVAEMVALSQTEPGTLVYDWYINADRTAARLHEAYDSVDSIMAHVSGPVFTELAPKTFGVCTMTKVQSFGDAGDLAEKLSFLPIETWGAPFNAIQR